jgi:glycosyltransferase involved in cell wall biosynthesis
LRILVLTSSFPKFQGDSSGVFVLSLCKELQKRGIKIEVVAPHADGCEMHEHWSEIGISRFSYFYPPKFQTLCYNAGILKNIRQDPLTALQLPFFVMAELSYAFRVARKARFDLIHAHWSIPQGLTGIVLRKVFGTPCMVSLHGSDVYGLRAPLLRSLNAKVIFGSDVCTANSTATAETARRLTGRDNIQVIPMGVNVNLFKSSRNGMKRYREEGPNILYAGRLIELKGVHYLIDAFPRILDIYPGAKLLIVGSGPYKSSLMVLSDRLKLQDRIQFIDAIPQEELLPYYSMADVFVLPSVVTDDGETEGLGVVLLEAMACETPVIGTRVGGIPDIIKDGETGLLVKEKDPEDLAEKVLRLLIDDDLRRTLAFNGRRLIEERFSWEKVAEKFLNLYQTMVDRSVPRSRRARTSSRMIHCGPPYD